MEVNLFRRYGASRGSFRPSIRVSQRSIHGLSLGSIRRYDEIFVLRRGIQVRYPENTLIVTESILALRDTYIFLIFCYFNGDTIVDDTRTWSRRDRVQVITLRAIRIWGSNLQQLADTRIYRWIIHELQEVATRTVSSTV